MGSKQRIVSAELGLAGRQEYLPAAASCGYRCYRMVLPRMNIRGGVVTGWKPVLRSHLSQFPGTISPLTVPPGRSHLSILSHIFPQLSILRI
ncbi:MAG: hypothetical protein AAFP92_08000 [Bacteroidota bacterium]